MQTVFHSTSSISVTLAALIGCPGTTLCLKSSFILTCASAIVERLFTGNSRHWTLSCDKASRLALNVIKRNKVSIHVFPLILYRFFVKVQEFGRIWCERSLRQEGWEFDCGSGACLFSGCTLTVSALLLSRYFNFLLRFKIMPVWQIGNSKLSVGVSVCVHRCGSVTCPGSILPSPEDNWDQLQQSEQRTWLEDYRSLTDACDPLFWLWLTGQTSQTSRRVLCLANPFDGFSLLSSFFFSLFSSPSASHHPKISSCCHSLTLVTCKNVMWKGTKPNTVVKPWPSESA